ncbi:hypothetical protein B0T11DRAFT_359202 [Plectosphaerella cucumerina]|uniref:Glucose-methanol-choline oxidoreductase N-terminal domain-containing protein n=1 Tax=Plectosphaerella cucumerina TaxID=40658 RepID=A0A8K0T6P3_9PEZI|nr:hypothetical protein B0T11DRAFT_359202 [Plectosphaerella cucumerina]
MRFSLPTVAALGLASINPVYGQASQRTTAYTDPQTGISFQRFASADVFSFGIALPETAGTDFIGQLVGQVNDAGEWASVSLRGPMLNSLLFVAWADGEEIRTSFRTVGSYSNPGPYTATEVRALPIAAGTFVNATHFSYTFLCQGCVLDSVTSLTSTAPTLGWAVSATEVNTPSDPNSALSFHGAGHGQFGLDIAGARSASFAEWAALASETAPVPEPPVTAPGTNTTLPGNGTLTEPTVYNTTYDIIVVGGGPAGIITAERLAEAGLEVLLIERGGPNIIPLGSTRPLPWNDSLTTYDIPALGSAISGLPGTTMCSDTASTAGCVFGGGSSINALNFIHPPDRDFDTWPAGWQSADVAAATARLYERNSGTTQPSRDGIYYDDRAFQILSGMVKTRGFSEVDSIQSPNEKHAVFSRPSWSIKDNLRAGPARTYMPFVADLPNFTLRLNTKVVQVNRNKGAISGVLVDLEGGGRQIINVKPGGKVVLAAGALSTPRLLWNSGIGRADAIAIVQSGAAQTGVTLPAEADWIDLPVGHHLQDHAQVVLQFNDSSNFQAYRFSAVATSPVPADLELYRQGSGPITQSTQRMHLWTSAEGSDGRVRYLQGTAAATVDGVITVRTFLTHGTTTVGELGITAAGNTVLNTRPWLIDPVDRAVMSDFVQFWLDVTGGANSTLSYIVPGSTPADIIAARLVSGDHWIGTAKMGVDTASSVVDLDTKVHGTDNLFVVDASIHPDLGTGNTQSTVMIVAEHAAVKIAGLTSAEVPAPGAGGDGCGAAPKRARRASMSDRRRAQ